MLDQLLEALVVGQGGLEFGHLFGRNITGDIPALFIALVIVVRASRALPDDTDGASVQVLNLSQFLEDGLRCDLCIHVRLIYV